MLREAVLVEARQEGELIAGRGRIENRLRVFAWLNLEVRGEEGGRD
jgi:hypothetical protein